MSTLVKSNRHGTVARRLAVLWLAVTCGLTAASGVASADTTVTTLSDHDTTIVNGNRYVALTPSATYAATEYRDADGAVGHRFELRDGDVRPQDQQLHGDNRQRDELVGLQHYAVRADLWFSFSYQWSGQMPSTWVSIADLFSPRDVCDAGRSGALTLQQRDGALVVLARSDATQCSVANPAPVTLYTAESFLTADTWHSIVGHVAFNPFGPTGFVKLWVDGRQVVRTVQIPLGYNDTLGPHFTFGQYRGYSSETMVFKFANEESSTTSLIGRVAAPLPIPSGL